MSKFIKCWVFIICLLFILLILFTDKVNAQVIMAYNWNDNLNSVLSKTQTVNPNSQYDFNTVTQINVPNGTEYITGSFYGIYMSTSTTIGIDLNATCNNTSYTTQPYLATITYADGTQAQILYSEYVEFCQNYNVSQGTIVIPNTTQDFQVIMGLKGASGYENTICTITNNNFKCPINNDMGGKISGIRLKVYNKTNYNTNIKIGLSSIINFEKSNETNINNSIQQQTQQEHQDNQTIINQNTQEYNFISNTTIDSNTTSNVNNIDTSNSDTKLAVTNFALIPLNFMQSIINSFSSSCSQVCIGNCQSGHINDWRFVFPCLDFESILGTNLYNIIDSLFAFGMVFAFIRSVRKFFINALLLTADASSEVGVFL